MSLRETAAVEPTTQSAPSNAGSSGSVSDDVNRRTTSRYYRHDYRGRNYYHHHHHSRGTYRSWETGAATAPFNAPSAVTASLVPVGAVHVFDFDGTLFRSPTPHPTRLDAKYGAGTVERLTQPVSGGGLGWFQSPLTLSHPYVPSPSQLSESWRNGGAGGAVPSASALGDDNGLGAQADAAAAAARVGAVAHFRLDGQPLQTLYVEPVCARFRAIQYDDAQRRQQQHLPPLAIVGSAAIIPSLVSHAHLTDEASAATPTPACSNEPTSNATRVVVAVMTGRDRSYHDAITNILERAHLKPDHIFLKPHPSAGTVKYKVRTFIRLISTYVPRVIEYYEDRVEQGAKIEAGVRFVQWLLSWAEGHPPQAAQLQLDVESNDVLLDCGIPRVLIEKVPPEHRSAYQRDLLEQGTLQKLLARNSAEAAQSHPQQAAMFGLDESSSTTGDVATRAQRVHDDPTDEGEAVHFRGKPVSSLAPEVETGPRHFRFVVHFVRDEWHPDSYLQEDLEDELVAALKREAEEAAAAAGAFSQSTTADFFARGSGRGGFRGNGYGWGRGGDGNHTNWRYGQGRGRRY